MRLARILLACTLFAPAAAAATYTVNVEDNAFNPSMLTICPGDTVTWNFVGSAPHTTTSGDGCSAANGAWDSGTLGNGDSFSYTFTTIPPECASDESAGADTCSYFCVIHCSMMDGIITISDSSGDAGLGISGNKLRISHDPTQGRGGTTLGAETLSGVTYDDVLASSTRVTLTLTAPGLSPPATATVLLDDVRGNYQGRFSSDDSQRLVITGASIRPTDVDLAKVKVNWETNGFDLNAVGPQTLTVTISHDVASPCSGTSTISASATKPVSN